MASFYAINDLIWCHLFSLPLQAKNVRVVGISFFGWPERLLRLTQFAGTSYNTEGICNSPEFVLLRVCVQEQ